MKLQDLIEQRDALERQINEAQRQERAEAIARVRTLMADHGLTVADVSSAVPASKGPTAARKVPAKYQDPVSGKTWSGRGLRPNWLKDALAQGRGIEEFAL